MTAKLLGPATRMQLARGLVALRERSDLTQLQVAERAGVSKATVSRYELWQDRARVRWATVKALADACDATRTESQALVALVQSKAEGWWTSNSAVPEWMNPLVSFECEAEYEHVYANTAVPGLLQTRDYAVAIHQACEFQCSDHEIACMVDARLRRQEILKGESRLYLRAVLDEAVLRRTVGDESVMAAQMLHLHEMAQSPNVDIHVLPFSAGAHAAGSGHFVLLGKEDEENPLNSLAVVYIEMRSRGTYLDDTEDVHSYKLTFDYLLSQAADTSHSLRLLATAQQEFLHG